MFFFLYFTVRVSLSKRLPRQTSQVTYTVGRKCISTAISPLPSQASQRPPLTLKENLFAFQPRSRASSVVAKRSRMWVKAPVYVARLERGVLPMGDWSMRIALERYSVPENELQLKTCAVRYLRSYRACKFLYKISYIKELLPLPETPVIEVITPSGTSTFKF